MLRVTLAIVCLSLAGCPGDDGTGDSGASDSEGGSAGSGGSGGTSATSATPTSTETTAPADGTTTGADTGGSSGEADPVFDACETTCRFLIECGVEIPNCGIPCAGINVMVEGCEEPYIAQQECVLGLTCEDASAWFDQTSDACGREDTAFAECIGGGE